VKVTLEHLRRVGYCGRGAKRACERHGIDWRRAIKEGGIEVSEIEHIDDAMIRKLVEVARAK